ncbi:MAG: paraquat-inducible protein A [Chthoniobacterales bacterium]
MSAPSAPSVPVAGDWDACHACEATYRHRELAKGEKLYCSRCGELLDVARIDNLRQNALALGLTGIVLLVLANVFPIMTFDVAGAEQSNHIFTGVRGLIDQNYAPIAALVFFSAILAPALYLVLGCYVLTARCLGQVWPFDFKLYRVIEWLAPWNLVPLFAVACLVAVVRLDLLGTVTWKTGAVFVVLLSLCCLLLEQLRESAGQESEARLRPQTDPRIRRQRAIALVAAGVVLYPFANILPVMTMSITGERAALTVWGGVLELYHVGLWPAAVIVFLASMCVPFLKLVSLAWLLWMDGKPDFRVGRTRLFRVLETVGTWSMVDFFLLSVLVAVGQLGTLASVQTELGALFFSAVLICTLFAAANYNVRMIWREGKA